MHQFRAVSNKFLIRLKRASVYAAAARAFSTTKALGNTPFAGKAP
jgi:hypothetical protein